jgi:hypothetical protein
LSEYLQKRQVQLIKKLEAEREQLGWRIEAADDGPEKDQLLLEYKDLDSALKEMQDPTPRKYFGPPGTTTGAANPTAVDPAGASPVTTPRPGTSGAPNPAGGTPGTSAPPSSPAGTTPTPSSTPQEGALAPPPGPKSPAIPTFRLDGDNAYVLNPGFIIRGDRLLVVQKTVAEGPEKLTVAGSTEQPNEPEIASGPHEISATQGIEAIKVVLTSLGRSSGDAFQMTVLNEGREPVTLTGDAFVLEPVAGVSQAAVDRELASTRGVGRATTTLKAYCLEFLKQPPSVGMVFRLAPADVQRTFSHVSRVFAASKKLKELGKLRPGTDDPSDPASYFDDIRQWAIWTQEQRFDEKSYTRAFTEHSRKNVEAAGHKWTRELEKAFTGLASGRWQAVQMVLREAATR